MAVLIGLALAIRLLSALPLRVPGYMDAYYYYVGAERIVQGYGLSEPYLWNYLAEPLTVPAPAFQFWLPLTSFLMLPFLAVFGTTFRAGQIPFIALSALLPVLAFAISYHLPSNARAGFGNPAATSLDLAIQAEYTHARRRAWLAGLLTVFTPFYVKYWVSTDNFTPFALTAGLALLAMRRAIQSERRAWFAVTGTLIGLSHLARADAPLLLAVLLLAGLWPGPQARPLRQRMGRLLPGLLLASAAYLIVMAPWLWRNFAVSGTLLGPAGARPLFLRSYDDLFGYGRPLTCQSYLAWGWPAILRSKLDAAGSNLVTVIVVFLSVFLAPLAGLELWARRRELLSRIVVLYLILLYLAMTLVFTFPGPRGSLLHSGAALLPFLMAFAVAGLERAVAWVARRRAGWDAAQANRVFGVGLVLLAAGMSAFIYARAVWAGGDPTQAWNSHDDLYRLAGVWLDEQGEPAERSVLVVNPPAFYYFARRLALAIPNEEPRVVADVCQRFAAGFLLLEANRPASLDGLFAGRQEEPALRLVHEWTAPDPEGKLYRCQP